MHPAYFGHLTLLQYLLKNKIPLILEHHDSLIYDSVYMSVLNRMYVKYRRSVYKKALAHRVFTKYHMNFLKNMQYNNVFYLPIGINSAKYECNIKEKIFSRNFKIIFLASKDYRKGLDLFIEILLYIQA